MIRLIISTIAVVALLPGIVLLVSPIPFGALVFAISLATLVCFNTSAQNIVKRLRKKYQTFNEKLYWLENKMENRFQLLSQSLIKTRPEFLDTDTKEN